MADTVTKLNVRVDQALLEQLKSIASSEGKSLSEVVRDLMVRGMDDKMVVRNKKELSLQIANEIECKFDGKIEDLTYQLAQQQAMLEKICRASAMGYYVTSGCFQEVATGAQKERIREIQMDARDKADIYLNK